MNVADSRLTRHLAWDACRNVRDLGGYETGDGGRTRWRALLRADNLCRLTPQGQAALIAYGVRTIVDVRNPSERAEAPHPFAQEVARAGGLAYLALPLLDEEDADGRAQLNALRSLPTEYCLILERYKARMAAILTAIAQAPDGGVLVHCHAGQDRTGLVVALLLAIAGVPHATIAADYAASADYLQPLYAELLAAGPQDPITKQELAARLTAQAETMLAVLSYLDAQYGGVHAYLRAAGVGEQEIERIRNRLRA
jgi:protein-tyrosine phosphatase